MTGIREPLSVLADSFRSGSPRPATEALFALLTRGRAAAACFRDLMAEPALRAKSLSLLAAQPARAVSVLASAQPASRAVLGPLLRDLPPSILLAGLREWLVSSTSAPSAALVEFTAAVLQGLPGASPESAAAQFVLGVMLSRTGDSPRAVQLLRQALLHGRGLQSGLAVSCAEHLSAAALAAGDRESAMFAVSALIRLGCAGGGAAAGLFAAALLEWPADAAGREAFAAAVSELAAPAGGQLGPLLAESWDAAAARLQAARRARRGYFAAQLRALDAVAGELARSLEAGEDMAIAVDPRLPAIAGGAAQRVSELLTELVAYQPLCPEHLDLRQAVLQVVLACREEVAADGLALHAAANGCGGQGGGPPPGEVILDPALVKGALRQVLLRLARIAAERAGAPRDGGAAPCLKAVLSARAVGPLPTGEAGALFTVAVSPCRGQTEPDATSPAVSGANAVPPVSSPGAAATREDIGPDDLARLGELLSASTLPDIAARSGGSYGVRSGPDGCGQIWLQFPPLARPAAGAETDATAAVAPAPVAAAAPDAAPALDAAPAGEPGLVRPGLSGRLDSGPAVRAAATSLLDAVAAARERAARAWAGELAFVLHEVKNCLAFTASWLGGGGIYAPDTIRQRCLENLADVRFWLDEAGVMLSREGQSAGPYVDLGDLTRRVLRGLAAGMSGKRVRLDLRIAGGLPKVPAEPLPAASVVRNLAKNALEVTPQGGVLSVSVEHVPAAARVAVTFTDMGPGFSPEILAGHHGRDEGALQSGLSRPHLGLVSARRILVEQGGELLLSNEIGGGGRAQACFAAERAASRLAEAVSTWDRLQAETRQALRAAAALAAGGQLDVARHLWRKALETETARLTRLYRHHTALQPALGLAAGRGGRPALTPRGQSLLARVFGPGVPPGAQAAARSVLGAVLSGRLRPDDLNLRQSALLLALFTESAGDEPDEIARRHAAAKLLFAAAEALGEDAADPQALEGAVLAALKALGSLGACRSLE